MPSASYVPLGTQRTVLVARSASDGPAEQLLWWSERYGLPGVGEIDVSLQDYYILASVCAGVRVFWSSGRHAVLTSIDTRHERH